MTKKIKILSIMLLNFILLMGILIPAKAAVIAESVVDYSRRGCLYIKYEDTVEGTDPVVNAEFTAYKIGELNPDGSYTSLIPGIDVFYTDMDMENVLQKVKEAYQQDFEGKQTYVTMTTASGTCSIQSMDLGLYIIEESKPAVEHLASVPFFAEVPYTENNMWWYDVYAEPKPLPCGDIKISKTVQGKNGDTKRDFHFIVEFKTYTEPVHYTKSTGAEGYIVSGGTIALKHNEYAVLDTIPVGEEYTVTEKEANQDKYVTVASGTSDQIYRKKPGDAHFVNTKVSDTDTGDSYKYLIAGGIAVVCVIIALILLIVLAKRKKKQNNE